MNVLSPSTKTSHPSDPVPSSLMLCVSSELSGACERPLENTLRSAVLVTLVSASDRRDPSADTESSRAPPATPLCSETRIRHNTPHDATLNAIYKTAFQINVIINDLPLQTHTFSSEPNCADAHA